MNRNNYNNTTEGHLQQEVRHRHSEDPQGDRLSLFRDRQPHFGEEDERGPRHRGDHGRRDVGAEVHIGADVRTSVGRQGG